MALYRLDKFLADMGCGTRSEVKNYIKRGRVTVNDTVVKSADVKVEAEKDSVSFDGNVLGYVEYEYYMLNKPQVVISATEDKKDRTVIDLIGDKNRKDLFPVGRLDKDTEGLLLITNDGQLAHNLLSPKKHVDKVYYVEADGLITEEMAEQFAKGVTLSDGVMTLPAKLCVLENSNNLHSAKLTIKEGKFHQVKRMFEACGRKVLYLKRLSMGTLVLDETLALGEYRKLTEEELKLLKGAKNAD